MSETGKKRLALIIILPILILAVGFFAFKALIGMKKAPKRQQPPQLGALVDVIELQSKAHQVKVHARFNQFPGKRIGILDMHVIIIRPVDHQERNPDLIRIVDRGTVAVSLRIFLREF